MARVVLRAYRSEDVGHFVALFTNAAVSGFVGGPRSEADSRVLFDSLADGNHERAIAAYAVTIEDQMVGHAVLFRHREPDTLELGYMIEESSWGQGIGTATARELLTCALGFGARFAIGTVDIDNVASHRILQRLGGQRSTSVDEEGELYVFRIPLAGD